MADVGRWQPAIDQSLHSLPVHTSLLAPTLQHTVPVCAHSKAKVGDSISVMVEGRGLYCLNVGGVQIDQAVADAFLRALTPATVEATQRALQQFETDRDAALRQWRLAVERARYEAQRAERQYRAVEPENRLARGLETEWEKRLRDLAAAEAELQQREQQRPRTLSQEEQNRIRCLGSDLNQVWTAPTTTDRDRKELLRALLEEVMVTVDRSQHRAHLTLRWRGGILTELELSLPHW